MVLVFLLIFLAINPNQAKAQEYELRGKAEAILKTKCMDCHSDQTVFPWYANLPVAKQLLEHDIKKGKGYFHIERDILNVKDQKEIQKYVIESLHHVISDNEMPPLQYRAMHWDKIITTQEREVLLNWTEQLLGKGLSPLPSKEEIIKELSLDENKIKLGQRLYHDTRLSGDNSISCASCHDLAKGGTDQAQFSTGIGGQKGHVNSPTVYNSVYNFKQFWDGRAEDLVAQAHGPVHNPAEMGSNWDEVIKKLKKDKDYLEMFKTSFAIKRSSEITGDMMAEAIAEFEKSLVTPDSSFDLYLKGKEDAVSEEVKAGYKLFKKYNCMSCHSGIALGGERFAKMGLTKDYFKDREEGANGLKKLAKHESDNGRFNISKDENDMHAFKVPLLRNVAITYPYMHDGNVESLEEAVRIMGEYQIGKKLSAEEIRLISSFLKSLTASNLD